MNQFFAPLAEPLGAVWCLMVLGVLWLLCRRQWRSALWLGLPTVLLFIIGSTSVAEMLVAAEERPWVGESGPSRCATMGSRDCGTRESDPSPCRFSSLAGEGGDDGQRSASPTNSQPATLDVRRSVVRSQLSTLNSTTSQSGTEAAKPAFAPADAVIALGGGQHVSHHDMLGFAVGEGGSRVLTAIELVRSGQARALVLGGSWPMPDRPSVPSMVVVQNWVTSWGLAGSTVTNLGICINTHDEAVAFRKLALDQGWLKVLLVTSALHMRRSVALFKQQGIVVTPVAADFQVQGVSQDLPFSPFPRQRRLDLLNLYMHEKIGWWAYRVRGWV